MIIALSANFAAFAELELYFEHMINDFCVNKKLIIEYIKYLVNIKELQPHPFELLQFLFFD